MNMSFISDVTDIVLRFEYITPDPILFKIIQAASGSKDRDSASAIEARLAQPYLALDPGQTTGVCFWNPETRQFLAQQWDTNNLGHSFEWLMHCLKRHGIKHLRYEDYRVYSDKADTHINNNLHTAQWIGGIQIAAYLQGIPCSTKMAAAAKTFWTDSKLELTGTYSKGMKHARDAMRHMLLMMTFPPTN